MPVPVLIPSPPPTGSATPHDPSTVSHQVFDIDDLATPVATLSQWFDEQTIDVENDAGHGRLTLQNNDAQLANCTRGRVIRKYVDATPAFQWIIDHTLRTSLDQDEEKAHITVLAGDGIAQILNRYLVGPARGDGQVPWSTARTFSCFSPEFTPGAEFVPATLYALQSDVTPFYAGLPANWWDPQAGWIGASAGNASDGYIGNCYLIGDHTFDAATDIVIGAAGDNRIDLYGDGFGLTQFGTEAGFSETHRSTMSVSPGQFRFGAKLYNYADGGSEPGPGRGAFIPGNPSAFLLTCSPVDGRGKLGPLAIHTDAEWSICEFPDNPPGWTHGGVMHQLLTEAAIPGLTWDFDATNDSNGVPFDIQETITVNVGDDYLSVLRSFSDFIDWAFEPDSLTLHMWRKGTRGVLRDIAYVVGGNLTALSHDAIDAGTDALLVAWGAGPQFYYPPGGGTRTAFFSAGNARTRAEAEALAARELAAIGGTRIEFKGDIEPVGLEDQPYTGPKISDLVAVPNETGAPSTQRITQIIGSSDDNAAPIWAPSFSDLFRDTQERIALSVKRMANGTLGGWSTVASPAGPPPKFGSNLTENDLTFSVPDPIATGESSKDDVLGSSGNVFEVFAILKKPSTSGTTDFEYWVDGVDILAGRGSIPVGSLLERFYVDMGSSLFWQWLEGNSSRLTLNITAVGTDASGLVVKGRVL